MNKEKCLNWLECHNYATEHSGLCEDCRRAAFHLDEQDVRDRLTQLEKKPRDWRDAYGVRRAK